MNTDSLDIGLNRAGRAFELPRDAVVQTFAILAIRGAGKTVTATVMAEEMCRLHLPWIAFDPVGIWWGLRCNADGSPGGFPVVVFGGDHADLPLEKSAGRKVAEALTTENVFAVIDLSRESKQTWRRFLTDFSLGLMDMNPEVPRHIFIEEAPEYVPQRTKVALTAECKEAVERLVRLGRNRGYGSTLISQRPATVDKDVLSQCENLFVLRTTGPHDRAALKDWISAQASNAGLEKFLGDVAALENGHAWFWSPHWLKAFEKVRVRHRQTFHPGATRTMGKSVEVATLSDVGDFVTRLKRQLSKTVTGGPMRTADDKDDRKMTGRMPVPHSDDGNMQGELQRLREELSSERAKRADAERRLALVRKQLEPQYQALRQLFEAVGKNDAVIADRKVWEPWLLKAGRAGCRRMLETLLEHPEVTQDQLATLAHCPRRTSTFRNYRAWLTRNGLVEIAGETIRLKQV